MDQNTALVLGGLILAVTIILFLMRRRVRRAMVKVDNIGEVDFGSGAGPIADGNLQEGKDHELRVSGTGSEALDNRQKGDGHKIIVGP